MTENKRDKYIFTDSFNLIAVWIYIVYFHLEVETNSSVINC